MARSAIQWLFTWLEKDGTTAFRREKPSIYDMINFFPKQEESCDAQHPISLWENQIICVFLRVLPVPSAISWDHYFQEHVWLGLAESRIGLFFLYNLSHF